MSRNLQVLDTNLGISCNVKYQPLNKSERERQKIAFKAPNGKMVKFTTVDAARKPVQTFKAYLDEDTNEYAKQQLTAVDPDSGDELAEFEATTVFDIVKYEPEKNYTDNYIIEKYYELFPSDDGKKKDFDREIARNLNLQAMKKLYDYLVGTKQVGKAEFVGVTGHYRAGAGYVRAITIDNGKWSLELGAFKEEKIFKHLQEHEIKPIMVKKTNGKKTVNSLL